MIVQRGIVVLLISCAFVLVVWQQSLRHFSETSGSKSVLKAYRWESPSIDLNGPMVSSSPEEEPRPATQDEDGEVPDTNFAQQDEEPRPQQKPGRTGFPHKIWQGAATWTVLGSDARVMTWLSQNPNYRYERITAVNEQDYVREKFTDRPEVAKVFLELEDHALRADLCRYLLLLEEGGVYSDLDTSCLKPIDDWIPAEYANDEIDLVIGIEGDSQDDSLISGFTYPVQFSQWTIMAKPENAILARIVDKVVAQIHVLAKKQEVSISGLKASYMDVIDTTGPGIWTKTIWDVMSEQTGDLVDWHNFARMKEPRLVGTTLVLPVTSFAAGVPHSDAGGPDDPSALVQHHFAGTWKLDHPMTAPAMFDPAMSDPSTQKSQVVQDPAMSPPNAGPDHVNGALNPSTGSEDPSAGLPKGADLSVPAPTIDNPLDAGTSAAKDAASRFAHKPS